MNYYGPPVLPWQREIFELVNEGKLKSVYVSRRSGKREQMRFFFSQAPGPVLCICSNERERDRYAEEFPQHKFVTVEQLEKLGRLGSIKNWKD
jgi:hypothetical protein